MKKTTIKLFLLVCVFCSVAIADDGDMGTGGKTCPPNVTCLIAPPSGGQNTDQTGSKDTITVVKDYLKSIFDFLVD